jgi:hypothetical protein
MHDWRQTLGMMQPLWGAFNLVHLDRQGNYLYGCYQVETSTYDVDHVVTFAFNRFDAFVWWKWQMQLNHLVDRSVNSCGASRCRIL